MKNLFYRLFTSLVALLMVQAVSAQTVSWKMEAGEIEDGRCRLVLTAEIPDGYHMYDLGPYVGGPTATSILFTVEGGEAEGELKALTEAHKAYDDIFMMEIGTYEMAAEFEQWIRLEGEGAHVTAQLEWQICNDTGCIPGDDELSITLGQAEEVAPAPSEEIAAATKDAAGGGSLWSLIIEAILWGFAALLTPCVFPMVPMTVSYFLKGEGGVTMGRIRAALYGFFIVALYTVPIAAIILITRLVGGDAVTADIFNWLATHWLPNVIFFLVFMVFAASFFGAFEITMPSWMVNKSDSKADTKGLGGIFFLALTLVLVSFSCTGPIVGSVLIKSTAGEFWTPILTMLAFSIAFALPFTIFAFFPSMLKNLPKSGGWLNSVKVVIGFIEVALGLKFLSVADQVYHWGILDREIYLAIWIVVFTLLGFYLLGKLKFAHDSEVKFVSVTRLSLAIVVFSFVVYLIPGMWGAPLKGLSGYLPPLSSQDFVLGGEGSAAPVATTSTAQQGRKYSDVLHLPHGLEGFFDLQEAEAYAKEVGKPIFLDFTGHGCVNCREMEMRVWSDPRVLEILKNDYVICALYADDKMNVDESEWVTTDTGKVLKQLGKINSYYALKTYGVNAQPYYVLQGQDGKPLVDPRGYNLDVEAFIAFLQAGIEAYNK
ncbi:MAG: thioredoxin family protein [Alistipes sp.]|nr:thioredoxin family protein [Alistipes sp.]